MPTDRVQPFLHLVVICLLAFFLRHTGWNWDEGQLLNPDERHMAMVTQVLDGSGETFNTETSGFNPYNQGIHSYVYGQLPLRLVHTFSVAKGVTSLTEITYVGRLFSALWSTGTVALLFLFAWRLVSARMATLAGLLITFTVFSIQQAHFYTVDSAGVFFATLCCGLGLLALKEEKSVWLIAAGACVGLAMSCRLNLGLLAFWIMAVSIAAFWNQRSWKPLAGLVSGGLLALLLFRICHPMAFTSTGFFPTGLNPRWLSNVDEVRRISDGTLEVPFTLQWVGRIPWLYAVQQIVVWGMGLPLGVLSVAGSLWLLVVYRHRLSHWKILLVLWPVLLIGYHGGIFLHTLRYFLPAYPMLILGGLVALRRVESPEVKKICHGLVLASSLIYSLAFINMYRQPHPRVEASEWLFDHLPDGGTVVSEHWDRGLPLYLEGKENLYHQITFTEMEVTHPESPVKLRTMLEQIDQADYLVLSSTKASKTLPLMPLRYPVMTRFYERLEESASRTGLKEVARFHRSPALLGWSLDTLNGEEALSVYDHPLVRIYEKTPVFSMEALEKVLSENIDYQNIPRIPYVEANRSNEGWLNPKDWEKRKEDVRWRQVLNPKSLGNRAPVFIWVIVLGMIGPLSFPFTFFLFPTLRDRGASVSRLLGLFFISFFAWWPAALGWVRFGSSLTTVSMLFAGGSVLIVVLQFEAFQKWLKANWKRLLLGESLQWGVFFFFLCLRFLQPDLWHPWAGGEKPMDFAYLTATVQSPYFPPHNPWLGGAFINYYYFGFVLFSSLIRLTGIVPEIAYNLALPTCALFIAGTAVALSRIFLSAFRTRPGWKGEGACSLLTVGLILFAGNLGQLREIIKGFPHPFNVYWNASRVIKVPEGAVQPITEFPFFSLLYGDLHAHLITLPLAMLCLLCSWQLFRKFHPLRLLVCSILLGGLQVMNTWDLPIQFAIFLFCLFSGAFPLKNPLRDLGTRLGWAVGALAAMKLSFAPFHWMNNAFPAEPVLWEGPRTSLLDLLLAHGLFLLPLFCGFFLLYRDKRIRRYPLRGRLLPFLLLGGCLFTIALVEFITLREDIGRMNMVFKFYYQVWWILAMLTAPVIVAVWPLKKWPYRIGCILLLMLSVLYPLTALPAKIKDRHWSSVSTGLDGFAYMQEARWGVEGNEISLAGDRAAIEWMRYHAEPLSVIMEAHRPPYQWGGRISWHSGMPTVLGWDWHMRQQRSWPGGEQAVFHRQADIETFYTTADISLLKKYLVRYVVIGELEELTYGKENCDRIRQHPGLHEVFQSQGTRILTPFPARERSL